MGHLDPMTHLSGEHWIDRRPTKSNVYLQFIFRFRINALVRPTSGFSRPMMKPWLSGKILIDECRCCFEMSSC